MREVTTGMREKGINNMEWADREEWRRKIKLYAFQVYEYLEASFTIADSVYGITFFNIDTLYLKIHYCYYYYYY